MRKNTGRFISAEAVKGKAKDKTSNGFNQSIFGRGSEQAGHKGWITQHV